MMDGLEERGGGTAQRMHASVAAMCYPSRNPEVLQQCRVKPCSLAKLDSQLAHVTKQAGGDAEGAEPGDTLKRYSELNTWHALALDLVGRSM